MGKTNQPANFTQTMSPIGARKLRNVERILLVIGLALLAGWAAARFHGSMASDSAIKRFHADTPVNHGSPSAGEVDFTQWSPQRITAYKGSLAAKKDLPLAILRIPKINLEVPIFNDTDDLTLNRGVGRILGTAQVGTSGNLGIAGHRDGFFRGLQGIAPGDVLELVRPQHSDRYAVSQIRIVTPEDTSVLNPTAVPTLTLVTCFPFYFVGHAPKRYIVTAQLDSEHESYFVAREDSSPTGNENKNKEKKNDRN